MLSLAIACIIYTATPKMDSICHRDTVIITKGESQWQKSQREAEEKNKLKPSPSFSYSNAEIIGDSNEQCVEAYKRLSGRYRSLGYAGSIPAQGNTPKVGAGALWKSYGHIGYVTAVSDKTITVEDANWVKGKLTRHILPVSEFRGFIYY